MKMFCFSGVTLKRGEKNSPFGLVRPSYVLSQPTHLLALPLGSGSRGHGAVASLLAPPKAPSDQRSSGPPHAHSLATLPHASPPTSSLIIS